MAKKLRQIVKTKKEPSEKHMRAWTDNYIENGPHGDKEDAYERNRSDFVKKFGKKHVDKYERAVRAHWGDEDF